MKKWIGCILLFVSAFSVFAAKTPEFSVKIVLTKAVNIEDQFQHILPGRAPFFPQVTKVVCGERFFVKIVFFNASNPNGSALLTGRVTTTSPGGKKEVIQLPEQPFQMKGNTKGVFLFPQSLAVTYEPQDPKGIHSFEVELTDKHAGVSAKSTAQLEYVNSVPADAEEKALQKLGNYYRAPCPENIIPAFRAYLKKIPAQKAREKNNFNPLPQLALFYFCLQENPQYIDAFSAEVAQLTDREEKIMGGVILHFLSDQTAKKLSAAEREQISRMVPGNPFLITKVQAPWHLDICWVEFFVRGNREPLLKIVHALSLGNDAISIPDFKKIAKPTREDRRKLFNGLIAMAAQWSINSLAKQHPLLRCYVEAALQRGEIRDPFAAAIAAKAIGLQVRIKPSQK